MLTLLLALLPAATAATPVCGTISTPTTWTAAGSPYVLTCDTTVVAGTTLTVAAGVTVLADPGTQLVVPGTLTVQGTSTLPVTFGRNVAASSWDGIFVRNTQGGSTTIDWATIDGATSALRVECCWGNPNPAVLDHVVLSNNDVGLDGYAGNDVVFDHGELAFNGAGATRADKVITNSWIHDNAFGVAQGASGGPAERMTIAGSLIQNNGTGVYAGNGVSVRYSQVFGNGVGISSTGSGAIERNDIQGNGVGVRVAGSPPLTLNNLDGNTTWAVEVVGGSTVLAPNNWWGTTSPAAIDATVFDVFDNSSRGLLDYTTPATGPVLTAYNPPSATGVAWAWTPGVSLGVDFTCLATDDVGITSVAWRVTGSFGTATATTSGLTWAWVAPADDVYDVQCTVTDGDGLHDSSPLEDFFVAADSDLDGVVDFWDLCPTTPVGSTVDDDGCVVPCDKAVYSGSVLTIPAVWLPSSACMSLSLTGPASGMTSLGMGACSTNACAPAAFEASTQRLTLPEAWWGTQAYTLVFEKVGATMVLQTAVPH